MPGCKLPGGAVIADQVRSELLATPVFIGLVTEASLASKYVLFELGARWGANKQLIPLLAPGISPGVLEGPISNINALSCGIASDLHALVEQVSTILSTPLQPSSGYQNELEIVLASHPAYKARPSEIFPAARQAAQFVVQPVPQAAVDELAKLRSEAVHEILNRLVSTDTELQELDAYTKEWWKKVEAALKKNFTIAEQLNFTRLGSVPNVIFPHTYNAQHAKILREFALQERRLLVDRAAAKRGLSRAALVRMLVIENLPD